MKKSTRIIAVGSALGAALLVSTTAQAFFGPFGGGPWRWFDDAYYGPWGGYPYYGYPYYGYPYYGGWGHPYGYGYGYPAYGVPFYGYQYGATAAPATTSSAE